MKNTLGILMLFICVHALGQSGNQTMERPKLVVGIVVDQMRQEYLYRFYDKFGDAGFKRLMNDGFMLKNAHFNYIPTETAPGHASVYTGTTPSIHGIIGNDWYEKENRKKVNCVNDHNQKVIGSNGGPGDISPARLLTTTITDELKSFTQKRSKVISISLKDRGAVLPAGHLGDAYWYDNTSGRFITSTYYTSHLPEWVEKFNGLKLADQYLSKEWKTFYPIEQYLESGADDSPYESKLGGKERATFPYNLNELRKKTNGYDLLQYFPFANDYITEMAKTAINEEKLGVDEWTDFLAVSFSTTDKLGHEVGPNAVEIEDLYIRLDKNIEDFLKTLDTKIGKDSYTIFLTADHGVPDMAQSLKDSRIPSGYFNAAHIKEKLNDYLKTFFPGKDLIEEIDTRQIFFNQNAFQSDPKSSGVELMVATELAMNFLLKQDGVSNVFSEALLRQGRYDEAGPKGMAIRGYHPKRSGDIIFVLEAGWYEGTRVTNTNHGSPYTYDTHVPVLFYGQGIKKGSSVKYHAITDIAPTLSVLLNIKFPSGCTGQPIEELFER